MFGLLLLVSLVALPAFIGSAFAWGEFNFGRWPWRQLHPGEAIVYRVVEASTHPGPEARDVRPAEHGDLYYYLTMKYWRVEEVLENGWLVALTPLHEHQYLRRDDPNLRKATLLERFRFAGRFPETA